MEIILSREIRLSDLEYAQKIICKFVEEFSSIYSDASILSGVHELLHLVECSKYFGPLNLINLFPYEELNRKCIRVIHGRDLMGGELIQMFSLIQSLSSTVREFVFTQETSQTKKYNIVKTSNRKRFKEAKDKVVVKIISKSEILNDLIIFEAIKNVWCNF